VWASSRNSVENTKRKRGRNAIHFPDEFVCLHARRNTFLYVESAMKENILGKKAKQSFDIGV